MTEVVEPSSENWKFKDGLDPEDPKYRKSLLVPADRKIDLNLVKEKQRVRTILSSPSFCQELTDVIQSHANTTQYPGMSSSLLSLQQISEILMPAPGKRPITSGGLISSAKRGNVIPINDMRLDDSMYSRREKLLRCKLASLYRLIDILKWNINSSNLVSARVSRQKEHYLVNPAGLLFHEITASSLVKMDGKGNILDPGSTVLNVNQSAWMLQSAIHTARPDVRVAIHLETPATVTVSVMENGLLPLCHEAMILGPISYFNLDMVTDKTAASGEIHSEEIDANDLKNSIAEAMGPTSRVLLVKSRGMFVLGETIEEAWHYATNALVACETQLMLANLGVDNLHVPTQPSCQRVYENWRTCDLGGIQNSREAVIAMRLNSPTSPVVSPASTMRSTMPAGGGFINAHRPWRLGELEFEAMMRHLDNAGYRTGHMYKHHVQIKAGDVSQMGTLATRSGTLSTSKFTLPRSAAQSPLCSDTEDDVSGDEEAVEIPPYTSSVGATLANFFSERTENDAYGDEAWGRDGAYTSGMSGDESDGPYHLKRQNMNITWFNTPNSYTRQDASMFGADEEDMNLSTDEENMPEDPSSQLKYRRRRKVRNRGATWVSDREAALQRSMTMEGTLPPPAPAHPLTPAAVPLGCTGGLGSWPTTSPAYMATQGRGGNVGDKHVYAPQGDNPDEYKQHQKKLREKYYKDVNTAGPQSRLLENLTWDEARRLRDESLAKALGPRMAAEISCGGQGSMAASGIVSSASKAIIRREARDNAVVYDGLYSHQNPFGKITDEELEMYRHEIALKQQNARSATLDHMSATRMKEAIRSRDEAQAEANMNRPYSDGEPDLTEDGKEVSSSGVLSPKPSELDEADAGGSKSVKKRKRRLFRFPFLHRKSKSDKAE